MRFVASLLRVGRYAPIGLTIMFFALTALLNPANAQTGISCDPLIPLDNLECPTGECRRFDADCGILGFHCNDSPDANTRSGKIEILCQWFCSGGRGVCEDSVVFCNDDSECDSREFCTDGTCSFVETPVTTTPPVETPGTTVETPAITTPPRDLQCEVDSDCLDSEGCWNNRCTRKCSGTGAGGCPTGEGCFNNFCAPL